MLKISEKFRLIITLLNERNDYKYELSQRQIIQKYIQYLYI